MTFAYRVLAATLFSVSLIGGYITGQLKLSAYLMGAAGVVALMDIACQIEGST